MTRFRPCIDLHDGKVKQIVGGSLRDDGPGPRENFVSARPSSWFAARFREDELTGGHVIALGPGNERAAREALASWPGGLQMGGGIRPENARSWIDAGASHVIVTSCLFDADGRFLPEMLEKLANAVGPARLVIDLSCRRDEQGWVVAMNRWQTATNLRLSAETLERLAPFCDEFLIHAADVEGLCRGIDRELVARLGEWAVRPVTYAGGAACWDELEWIQSATAGRVDVTIGSALDLFGGAGFRYEELIAWNRRAAASA
jgi:phosphoribosylformimino-5-aminoimidazole carboxamide ribotide isomerase